MRRPAIQLRRSTHRAVCGKSVLPIRARAEAQWASLVTDASHPLSRLMLRRRSAREGFPGVRAVTPQHPRSSRAPLGFPI